MRRMIEAKATEESLNVSPYIRLNKEKEVKEERDFLDVLRLNYSFGNNRQDGN